ncbi:DedA family protein [Bacillus methanolicus]|uniref:VTT domain-containing protein n=1 Tax=Bacillus methanolicus TaxID=1471 RepID=UPI00200BABBA|nr:VTT domain-containing protein [Bacillus methanolicus]UQD53135.1 DedA family protein [Bacillus methanolicus]
MSHWVSIFQQHSYLILFAVIVLELLALPISGEFFMGYAGYLVFQGKMSYFLAVLTVIVAGGIGITVTYWLGRIGGYKLIEKYGRYIHLSPKTYDKIASWMEKSGSKLLVFAYFIPGVRHFTGYVSGISRMTYRTFITPAYVGASLWGFCFITLGKALGPRWDEFHKAAGRYLIIAILILALFLGGLLIYKMYKSQMKNGLLKLFQYLVFRFRTIRAVEVFLISLAIVLLSLVIWMMGLAQDYLYNEFTQFNEITSYIIHANLQEQWKRVLRGILSLQSPNLYGVLILITIVVIWRKNQNRWLEFLLLTVILLGMHLYREMIIHVLFYVHSFWKPNSMISADFPNKRAMTTMVVYGVSVFLLLRHTTNVYIQIVIPILSVVFMLFLAIVNIALTPTLPSDIVGGYVYGSVWIFLNFFLFEMLRIMVNERNGK